MRKNIEPKRQMLRLVHETGMNRMRAKYKRIHKICKYSNMHTYFIGIFAYVFAISSAYSSTIMVSTKVGGGHPHYG